MAKLQSLLKDTTIYGMSSIVGRFLNYMLVPLYTRCMSPESGGYGVVTNLYAHTALIMVVLIFGMETTFFRFANKEGADQRQVLSNSFWVVTALAALFLVTVFTFLEPIASALGYADHPWWVGTMALVIALDSIQSVLFAWLRHTKRPIRFAALKLAFIVLNITLNCIYYIGLGASDPGPVFTINLICTAFIMLLLLPQLRLVRLRVDMPLLRGMFTYTWPVVLLNIAGILNQTFDKIIYPIVKSGDMGQTELGIYGACVKIAMIMAMITQAFRFAYEPFVFGATRDKDSKEKYAVAMKFFLIFTLLAYLCVMGGMPILRLIIDSNYWSGLRVVPIVMAAEIMMGIYFNLSFWYKLIDKTIYGAWFSLAGCIVLAAVNFIGIPHFGYMACAWGGVAGYGTCMVLSYVVGQRKNPIPYDVPRMMMYVALTAVLHIAIAYVPDMFGGRMRAQLVVGTVAVLVFIAIVVCTENLFAMFKQKK